MSLFSKEHIENQQKIHSEIPAYGQASMVFAPMVSELVNANQVTSLLDYGCGLGQLSNRLELNDNIKANFSNFNYDPALPEFSAKPEPAEMVICLDVLDVVEDECVDSVLDDLVSLTDKIAFFSINTSLPAEADNAKELEAEAHFKPVEWWLPKIMERFELHYFSRIDNGFVVVLRALNKH